MGLKSDFIVTAETDKNKFDSWYNEKHYAKRKPNISYQFALKEKRTLIIKGVVSYGSPASPQVANGFFGNNKTLLNILELNRLVINSDAPKNSASFLISKSIKLLPGNVVIISYSDRTINHVGYVYQASNFFYCGIGPDRGDVEVKIDGKWVHKRTICARGVSNPITWAKENNLETKKSLPKHRYIYFKNKNDIKYLKYEILPYPKEDNLRYECTDIFQIERRKRDG